MLLSEDEFYEHPLKLASDNEIEIDADDLGRRKKMLIKNLESYLKVQRRIFTEAA